MKTTAAIATFTGLIAATQAQYFGLTSARSASPIHYQPINAAGLRLWIGANSAHYCPSSVQKQGGCPNTHFTNFAGGHGGLSMGAVVPGGQQVYIDPVCGAVSYTQAHSAAMPEGAIVGGWSIEEEDGFGILSWEKGLLACNTTVGGPWGIYGVIDGVTPPGDCLGFNALTSNETKPAAWQYE